jgi:hypothetical protein
MFGKIFSALPRQTLWDKVSISLNYQPKKIDLRVNSMYGIQSGVIDNKVNNTLKLCEQHRKSFGKVYEIKDQIKYIKSGSPFP